jgi:hypothetical protein
LLVYIEAIYKARLWDPGNWLLQEDRDLSYSIRKQKLGSKAKKGQLDY